MEQSSETLELHRFGGLRREPHGTSRSRLRGRFSEEDFLKLERCHYRRKSHCHLLYNLRHLTEQSLVGMILSDASVAVLRQARCISSGNWSAQMECWPIRSPCPNLQTNPAKLKGVAPQSIILEVVKNLYFKTMCTEEPKPVITKPHVESAYAEKILQGQCAGRRSKQRRSTHVHITMQHENPIKVAKTGQHKQRTSTRGGQSLRILINNIRNTAANLCSLELSFNCPVPTLAPRFSKSNARNQIDYSNLTGQFSRAHTYSCFRWTRGWLYTIFPARSSTFRQTY